MKQVKILIANITEENFTNKKTGEVNSMLCIHYLTKVGENERFHGCAILKTYCKSEYLNILKKYIMREVNADISEQPTENGVKYLLQKINNEKVR